MWKGTTGIERLRTEWMDFQLFLPLFTFAVVSNRFIRCMWLLESLDSFSIIKINKIFFAFFVFRSNLNKCVNRIKVESIRFGLEKKCGIFQFWIRALYHSLQRWLNLRIVICVRIKYLAAGLFYAIKKTNRIKYQNIWKGREMNKCNQIWRAQSSFWS